MSSIVSNGNARQSTATAAGLHEGPGHVPPPPRWAHYETDLSSILGFAPRELSLEILRIVDDSARDYCVQLGLDRGDRITRIDGSAGDVLLSTEDGKRVRLPLPVALVIEVAPALPS